MTRSKVVEARERVMAAATELGRLWASGPYSWLSPREMELVEAVHALDELGLEPITDSEGSYVVGSPETSRKAAKAMLPKKGLLRRQVLHDVYCRSDGLASDEMIERSLQRLHQSVSSARYDLVRDGWLEDSRQRTKDGKRVLWQLTEAAKRALREEAM